MQNKTPVLFSFPRCRLSSASAKVCKPSEMPNLFEYFRGAAYLRHSQSVQTERNAKFIWAFPRCSLSSAQPKCANRVCARFWLKILDAIHVFDWKSSLRIIKKVPFIKRISLINRELDFHILVRRSSKWKMTILHCISLYKKYMRSYIITTVRNACLTGGHILALK